MPRTFLGAVPLAWASAAAQNALQAAVPARWMALAAGFVNKHDVPLFFSQLVARCVLGSCCSLIGLRHMAVGAAQRFGWPAASWLLVLTAVQFHYLFYASRLLPNTMATPFVLLAHGEWLSNRKLTALALLSVAVFALRCDVAALAIPLGLLWCLTGLPLPRAALVTICSGLLAIAASVAVDSPLWQRPFVWPEGAVLAFNNPVENRSAAWGVSAWHWYLTSAIPRALTFSLPAAFVGVALEPRRVGVDIVLPALASIALLSLLPHKELRFIFPQLPLLTLAAAVGIDRLTRFKRSRVIIARLLPLALVAGCLATTALFAAAARLNYPGES